MPWFIWSSLTQLTNMKLLLVSLLVALPTLSMGKVPIEMVDLKNDAVKQCSIAAGITEDQYSDILQDKALPYDEAVVCTIIDCSLQKKGLSKDGRLDKAAVEAKIKEEIPHIIGARAAVPDFLQCGQNQTEGQSACHEASEYMYCIYHKTIKYNSPLMETPISTLKRCQTENNVTEDEINDFNTSSSGEKCMMACILDDKGAVFENKLDVKFINSKILEYIEDSPVRRYATSILDFIEDFKKCSPNVTDPAGTKNICDGAYDLYECMYRTEDTYRPKKMYGWQHYLRRHLVSNAQPE